MATEQGIVTKVESDRAWVTTTRTGACESCTARGACHTMGGGSKDTEVEAINQAGAKVGDKIMLSFETSSLFKAMFLLYVFPILCLMVGAGIGLKVGEAFSLDTNMSSLLISLIFLVLSIWFVKSKGNRLSCRSEYQPKIIKVLHAASLDLSPSEQEPVQA